MLFLFEKKNIARSLSTHQACEVSAMTEGSIPIQIEKTVNIVFIVRIC